jgi:hypothetical protein
MGRGYKVIFAPLEPEELAMVDFLLVILLSGICTHGWIGLEEGNKGI